MNLDEVVEIRPLSDEGWEYTVRLYETEYSRHVYDLRKIPQVRFNPNLAGGREGNLFLRCGKRATSENFQGRSVLIVREKI